MIEKLPLQLWPKRQILTILIFHRILSVPDPLRPGMPDACRFDRLMGFFAKNFNVLPLAEAVNRLKAAILPRRACCITFDDGYADNLTIALPILEKYRLPATVFVASGYLDGKRMFNDIVIDAIAHAKVEVLDLRSLELGIYQLTNVDEKLAAVSAILERIKYSQPELRNQQVQEIVKAAGCGPLSQNIMLTSDQLRELSNRGIEIGGHTCNHPILTSLDDEEALNEIVVGKQQLEAIIGKPVTSFAYPNGKPGRDFAPRHVELVKQAGFTLAVTTAHGVADAYSDVFQLPRFTPWGKGDFKIAVQMVMNSRGAV